MNNEKRKIVLASGTFNIIHPGHLYFLKKAKNFGDLLYVVVARKENVRGKKFNILPIKQRVEVLKSIKWVDKVFEGKKNPLDLLCEVKPDVIVLGFDQKLPFSEKELNECSKKIGKSINLIKINDNIDMKNRFYNTTKLLKYVCGK